MKILRVLFLVLLVATAGLLAMAAMKPDTYRVERAALVGAPASVVFGQVNDFHQWIHWSPWEGLDPAMKRSHEGAPSGVGAIYSWVGNDKVGEGRMTIVESAPDSRIGIKLEFIKPWTATNQTAFTFTPEGDGTRVVWAMDGNNDFMSKLFSVFMDMDQMIGTDFERGLARLDSVARSLPAPAPADSAATAAAS